VAAVGARVVAEAERGDDEVAAPDVGDVAADVLDDADELLGSGRSPGSTRRGSTKRAARMASS
jgi:hypothetical protein